MNPQTMYYLFVMVTLYKYFESNLFKAAILFAILVYKLSKNLNVIVGPMVKHYSELME